MPSVPGTAFVDVNIYASCESFEIHHGMALLLQIFSRPDQQNENCGNECDAGENAENDVQRYVQISERTETPIGKTAATDADQIHDPVAGRAQLGSSYLTENGHIVAVKEAPADAK